MSDERMKKLHLPDLSITGFRGVGSLSIARLGRVTMIAGRNGVGKTTVLDAVRVYAARGHPVVLDELLERREEFMSTRDDDNDLVTLPDYAGLFHGWDVTQKKPIIIGPKKRQGRPSIRSDYARRVFAGTEGVCSPDTRWKWTIKYSRSDSKTRRKHFSGVLLSTVS